MVASAAIGGTLQYGYNLAIMNSPTIVSNCQIVCVCSGSSRSLSVDYTQVYIVYLLIYRADEAFKKC